MSKPIISVKGLSKAYMIGHEQRPALGTVTLRDTMMSVLRKPGELLTGQKMTKEQFWALKDISFKLDEGDVVGIIGRNGSGKSTLLKILSRIVEPTEGEAIMRGRIASLLEVGTGFHPELTGRENIFFNGAILGMSQKEIKAKFDDIVEFSEVEKFLDTPVKFYSSGMYVRLAFAVAVHLEPEILIVDEVLAVGDAAFQKKSLAKMKDIAKSGKTVLFVSHSMGSIKQICKKAVLLQNGKMVEYGPVDDVIQTYLNSGNATASEDRKLIKIDEHNMEFKNFTVNEIPVESDPEVLSGDTLTVEARYVSGSDKKDLCVGFGLKNQSDGSYLVFTHSHLEDVKYKTAQAGHFKCDLKIPRLAPGSYTLEVHIWIDGKIYIQEQELGTIHILPAAAFRTNVIMNTFPSTLIIDSNWKFTTDEDIT